MSMKYLTVGPSQLHPHYLELNQKAIELNLGSMYHRSEQFRKIYQETDEQLKILLRLNNQHSIYFTSGGSEIWEKVILNLVQEKSHHIVTGDFGSKFFEFAQRLQKQSSHHQTNRGEILEIEKCIIPNQTELVALTQNETSNGYMFTPEDLILLREKTVGKLLCNDVVSLAPLYAKTYSHCDTFFFSVQKAMGMPPGLGVWIVNDACKQKALKLQDTKCIMGAYHTLLELDENYQKWETPSTPNVIGIYILGQIAKYYNNNGIDALEQQLNEKAQLLYTFVDKSKHFTTVVTDKRHLSKTTIVLKSKLDNTRLLQQLNKKGFSISKGYGKYSSSEIRIANFPQTSVQDFKDLIKELEKMDCNPDSLNL